MIDIVYLHYLLDSECCGDLFSYIAYFISFKVRLWIKEAALNPNMPGNYYSLCHFYFIFNFIYFRNLRVFSIGTDSIISVFL